MKIAIIVALIGVSYLSGSYDVGVYDEDAEVVALVATNNKRVSLSNKPAPSHTPITSMTLQFTGLAISHDQHCNGMPASARSAFRPVQRRQ